MTVAVADVPRRHRYEVRVDDRLAGFTRYRERPGVLSFVHTEVEEDFEGRGLGGELVGYALADARERGLAVLPFCPFVRGYIERHPDFAGLVPADQRERFGL